MKIEFARDDEIDAANLARRIQMIASHEGDGYEGDAAFTNSVREEVNQDQSLFRPIDSRDHLVKMFVFLPEDKSAAVMRASAVFDTTPEECVAMETEKESRAIMKKDEYLEKSILHLNAHSYVPPPPLPRSIYSISPFSCARAQVCLSRCPRFGRPWLHAPRVPDPRRVAEGGRLL